MPASSVRNAPMRCLVTAGPTREKIDQVRDWGNIFTGTTGLSIAKSLAQVAEVDLLTSNTIHVEQLARETFANSLHAIRFQAHSDLRSLLADFMARNQYDAVYMTAAVSDYTPTRVFAVISRKPDNNGAETWQVQDVQAGKVKSTFDQIAVVGARTEKIIDLFRSEWNFKGMLVKFKLEVGLSKDQLLKVGHASRLASGADYLVANTLDMVHGPNAGAFLLSDQPPEWIPRDALPQRMRELLKST